MISDETQNLIKKVTSDFIEVLKRINDTAPEVTKELSKYGWYLGLIDELGSHIKIYVLLRKDKIDEIDHYMSTNIKNRIDWIERYLIEWNPKREKIIKEAIENHKLGKYFSSISLLLTQVDGMCKDVFGKAFFSKDRTTRLSHLKPLIDTMNMYSVDWYRAFFEELTAINDDDDKSSNYPQFLNRHNILHGFDTEYGTEINSLKIISFLVFMTDLINLKQEKSPG